MAIEEVEPGNCILWQFHPRLGDEVTGGSCEDLINSVRQHGQRQPALGRRIEAKAGATIELIYGGRRLFAATALGVRLVVDVRDIDDRAAAVEMEVENRLRADISPYERGMSYRRWLNAGLFRNQSEMAAELGVSEPQISRLLRYAELPAAVISAFDSARSIKEEWAVALAKSCQDSERRPQVIRRAREIVQAPRRYPSHVVYRRLISDAESRVPNQSHDEIVKNSFGKPVYRLAVRANAVHFIVPRDRLSGRLLKELKSALLSALEESREQSSSRHSLFLRAGRQNLEVDTQEELSISPAARVETGKARTDTTNNDGMPRAFAAKGSS